MASLSLSHMKAGNFQAAAIAACNSLALIQGPGLIEAAALAAVAFEKAGDYASSLRYWDQIVESAPHKTAMLDAAIRSAWRMQAEYDPAGEKLLKWLGLLDWIYAKAPPFELLMEAARRGWQGNGAAGIRAGLLQGWLWLPAGEKPAIKISGPGNAVIKARLTQILSVDQRTLYTIEARLPKIDCLISVLDGAGKHVGGSPLVVSSPRGSELKTRDSTPAIILPVYGNRCATLGCIGSALASRKKNRTRFNLLVVWDGGQDQQLLSDLRRLAQKPGIKLIENEQNVGFIGSINAALKNCGGDVILLNSDTIVHGDWVDRLLEAGSAADAATVTALGNEAELMSYPSPQERGKIARLAEVRLYDRAAASLGSSAVLEIPVGVGFCMLVKARALNRIGGFDGRALFRGYGEEVDFCLRANEAGLRNYGAFNVFVGHLGSRSFGAAKKALAAQNNEIIAERYPDYRRDYEIFLHRPEAPKLREALSLALLPDLAPCDVLELRPWGHRKQAPWLKDPDYRPDEQRAVLFYKAGQGGQALLRLWANLDAAEINFELPEDLEKLRAALRNLRISCYRDMTDAIAIRQAFDAELGLDVVWEYPPDPNLPALAADSGLRSIICAPPGSMRGVRALLAAAQSMPQAVFYILELDSVWKGLRLPPNVKASPPVRNYIHLRPDAFAMTDNYHDSQAWLAWLTRNGCPALPAFRICQ